MFLAYSLLFTLGLVLMAPYYLWRLRGKIFAGAGWRERFGFLPASFQQKDPGAVWVHAVSVGETLAVVPLVRRLQRLCPERKIFISHVTPAGREAGENRLPGVAGRFYLPLDWRWSVERAMERLSPGLLLIVETELWPNLLHAARERGSRVMLVNARLSDCSFRRYRWIRRFVERMLREVDWVAAQSAKDAERFRTLGAPPERVCVTGNLKFDAVLPEPGEFSRRLPRTLMAVGRYPVVVAASTMPGEEWLVLQAWREVARHHAGALLILAPRHPARFEMVVQLLAAQGWQFVRRTALEAGEAGLSGQLRSPEVLLLDTMGELAGLLECADAVFMGGSFVPTGGHNLLEPAYWAKPILFGPHMENFRDIARQFLEGGAAVQVPGPEGLARALLDLLCDPARQRQMGEAARLILKQGAGATERVLEQIKAYLETNVTARAMA